MPSLSAKNSAETPMTKKKFELCLKEFENFLIFKESTPSARELDFNHKLYTDLELFLTHLILQSGYCSDPRITANIMSAFSKALLENESGDNLDVLNDKEVSNNYETFKGPDEKDEEPLDLSVFEALSLMKAILEEHPAKVLIDSLTFLSKLIIDYSEGVDITNFHKSYILSNGKSVSVVDINPKSDSELNVSNEADFLNVSNELTLPGSPDDVKNSPSLEGTHLAKLLGGLDIDA